jgi:hypothetical protein
MTDAEQMNVMNKPLFVEKKRREEASEASPVPSVRRK